MDAILSPVLLYLLLSVGALGVVLALPRKGVSPQLLGALVAAIGFGGILAMLAAYANQSTPTLPDQNQLPNLYFYVFAAIAILSALRVITHQRPVYAALYFILVILASSALYLLMGAEFMAFALIIIYAGAILITYLFVIMLATQAPTEGEDEALSIYDAYARDPLVSTVLGFLLLAALSGVFARGVQDTQPLNTDASRAVYLAELPKKVNRALDNRGVFAGLERPTPQQIAEQRENLLERFIVLDIADEGAFQASLQEERVAELLTQPELFRLQGRLGLAAEQVTIQLPPELRFENIDGVGYTLIAAHPMALEVAGVILLMAMLGAVVLARKQIELGDAEKSAQERELAGENQEVVSTPAAGPLAGEER